MFAMPFYLTAPEQELDRLRRENTRLAEALRREQETTERYQRAWRGIKC